MASLGQKTRLVYWGMTSLPSLPAGTRDYQLPGCLISQQQQGLKVATVLRVKVYLPSFLLPLDPTDVLWTGLPRLKREGSKENSIILLYVLSLAALSLVSERARYA